MKIQFLLKSTAMFDRLGIMTLSSILKQNGYSVQLLLTEELSEKECVAKVKEYKPDVILLTQKYEQIDDDICSEAETTQLSV